MTAGTAQELKIGDVAAVLETTPRTIRYYEEEGLLVSRKSPGGTRLYAPGDVHRLRAILKLAGLGLSLEEIRALAAARERSQTGAESSEKVAALLHRLLERIAEQKKTYARLEREIGVALGLVRRCRHCPNKPTSRGCPRCPVKRNLEVAEILNLIWDQQVS